MNRTSNLVALSTGTSSPKSLHFHLGTASSHTQSVHMLPAVAALVSHDPAYDPWTKQGTRVQVHGFFVLGIRENAKSACGSSKRRTWECLLPYGQCHSRESRRTGSKAWREAEVWGGETDRQTDRQTHWCSSLQTQPFLIPNHVPPWVPGDTQYLYSKLPLFA